MNEMNSDEGVSRVLDQHKKRILLHNDCNGWLSYIAINWGDDRFRSEDNVRNWINILDKIKDKV